MDSLNQAARPVEQESAAWGLEQRTGLGLFLGVLLFFGLKAPDFSVPGRWAGMLSSFWGLEAAQPLLRPVWSAFMFLASLLPASRAPLLVNLFSALVGAGVCWLLFEIVRRIAFDRGGKADDRMPLLMAGVFAALIGAVSRPIMTVATQGDFYIMDAFLLLLGFYPSMLFLQKPRAGLIYASFFAFGLALAENPTAAMVLPGFLFWWLYLIWRSSSLKISTILLAGAAATAAVLLALGTYLAFRASHPGIVHVADAGILDHLTTYMRLYAAELARSVPKVGWLLIIGTNIVPLFFVVFRALDEPEDFFTRLGVYPFRLLLFLLGIAMLFELPGSPSQLLRSKVLLVAPYVNAAIWFGHFLGYYYRLAAQSGKTFPRRAFVGVSIVTILAAGYLNYRATPVTVLRPVSLFADEVIAGLQGRTYLVTDGTLDASLRLSARKAGLDVRLINAANDTRTLGDWYASLFDNPELKNAAYLGARALLNEWMNHPESLTGQVAVLNVPHIVPASGFVVYPAGASYRIDKDGSAPTPDAMFALNEDAWTQRAPIDLSLLKAGDNGWFQLQFIQRWTSRMANDLGVLLDEQKRTDLAAQAYEQSLAAWPDNISAIMNQLAQAQDAGDKDQTGILTERIKAYAAQNREGLSPQFIRQVCGTVRNPMMNFEAGAMLARTGQLRDAMEEAGQAAELLKMDDAAAQLELARLFLRGNRADESERLLREVLVKDPENLGAHLGLLQVALQRENFDEAGRLIQRLQELGLDAGRVAHEKASLLFASGRTDEAKAQFLEIVKQPSPPGDAWFALARIAEKQNDEELLTKALDALKKESSYPAGQYLLGETAMKGGRVEEARRYFERVLAIDPAHVPAMVRLGLIDFDRRDALSLRNRAAALLSMDPDNMYGHFFAGTIHIAAGRLDLAEASMRRSIAGGEYDLAHNDLAWLLNERGASDEAMTHALRAIELSERNPNFWDTLAAIHAAKGDHAKAVEAVEKALELSERDNAFILVHAGKLYLAAGETEKARQCMEPLVKHFDKVPNELRADIAKIQKEIKIVK